MGLGSPASSTPACLHAATSAALLVPEGSAATILMLGLMDLAAMAIPEIRPPPDTGTTRTSNWETWGRGGGWVD